MIPTKENIAKWNAERRAEKKKPKVHQKISNTFIENAISKSNLSALKTLYYLSTVLSTVDLQTMEDNKIVDIKIDKRDMLKFTGLTANTIIKTTKQMQQTAITFRDEKNGTIEGMSLLPRYFFVPNKNIVELDLYVRIAKMIVDVKKNYTNINIKELMNIKNKHSLRLLALLCRMSEYSSDVAKRKRMTLDELNLFFGTNYKTWNVLERKIIKPVQQELDNNSRLTFTYKPNYEILGRGRPSFRDVTIDVIDKKTKEKKEKTLIDVKPDERYSKFLNKHIIVKEAGQKIKRKIVLIEPYDDFLKVYFDVGSTNINNLDELKRAIID